MTGTPAISVNGQGVDDLAAMPRRLIEITSAELQYVEAAMSKVDLIFLFLSGVYLGYILGSLSEENFWLGKNGLYWKLIDRWKGGSDGQV